MTVHNSNQPGGYIKLGARFHNPHTAAFTQPDPEPGNMGEPLRLNPYQYGMGDPCNQSDPSGRSAVENIACGLGLFALFYPPVTVTVGTVAGGVGTLLGCSAAFEYSDQSPAWNPAGGYTQYDYDSSY